ncbi:MAG: hypothetical protein MJB14_05205, partial [Spirochaetes bacterium]|nr:hypothetical protein [Spirochaetota bacterium]
MKISCRPLLLIIFFSLVLLFSQCKSQNGQTLENNNLNQFENKAESLIQKERFFDLRKMSKNYLKQDESNYYAAYYYSYAMMNFDKKEGIRFYLNYIKDHPEMPEEYKKKWLNIIAQKKLKPRKINLDRLYSYHFSVPKLESESQKNLPKIISINKDYLFLDTNGIL